MLTLASVRLFPVPNTTYDTEQQNLPTVTAAGSQIVGIGPFSRWRVEASLASSVWREVVPTCRLGGGRSSRRVGVNPQKK